MKKHLISFFVWSLMPMTLAMSQATSGEKQAKLEKDRPAVYVTFECVGRREPLREGESNKGVWLRLHNNLRWALTVPGFTLAVPWFAVPTTLASKNQADDVVLYYEVEDTRMRRGRVIFREVSEKIKGERPRKAPRIPLPPIGYRMTDLVKTIQLPSGSSVLFSLPYEHLTRDFAVSLSFRFEWEEGTDETDHRVYFYGNDLPDTDVRQCR